MPKLTARIACLILAGITLAVTAGAAVFGDLPIYVAVPVGIAVTIVAILGDK